MNKFLLILISNKILKDIIKFWMFFKFILMQIEFINSNLYNIVFNRFRKALVIKIISLRKNIIENFFC